MALTSLKVQSAMSCCHELLPCSLSKLRSEQFVEHIPTQQFPITSRDAVQDLLVFRDIIISFGSTEIIRHTF